MTDDELISDLRLATRLSWRTEVALFAALRVMDQPWPSADEPSLRSRITGFLTGDRHRASSLSLPQAFNRELVLASGLFDDQFYSDNNLDVRQAGQDNLDHYLARGGIEGRRPGPCFDGALYLQTYEDVAVAGLNPLVHFVRYGVVEGRNVGLTGSLPSPVVPPRALCGSDCGGRLHMDELLSVSFAHHAIAAIEGGIQRLAQWSQAEMGAAGAALEREDLAKEVDALKRRLYLANSSLQRAVVANDVLLRDFAQLEIEHERETRRLRAGIVPLS